MDLPSKHVLDLSKRIGSRGAGSEGESAAGSYILRVFSEFDIDADVETFSTWKSDTHALLILYLAGILAFLVFRLSYTWSLTVSLLVFFLFQMETYSWAVVSKILPRTRASNFIGRIAPGHNTRHTVLIVANYDSAKSSPLGNRRIARFYRLLYVISFICIVMILILSLFGQGASLLKISRRAVFFIWICFSPFAAFLLFQALMLLFGEVRGRYTAGANDNASGVGVMLSLVAALAASPLEHTEVWGVATGRGFAGGRGMISLLKRHHRTLKDAFIVNLDHVGRGPTRVITREGVMLGFRPSRKLCKLALSVAGKSRSLKIEKGRCRVKKSDAMVANVRGYRAISIGGTSGGTYDGWRNSNDVFNNIQRAALDRTMKFVQLLLDEIDSLPEKTKKTKRRVRRLKHDVTENDSEIASDEYVEDETT